jgi:DNA-binding transcriptional ArsR family regulator
MSKTIIRPTGCSPERSLSEGSILSVEHASELQDLFKVLANDTRIRILHALARFEEMRVSELCDALGMRPQAVSNQLQRLSDRGILNSRRNGNSVYYRVTDPCVTMVLEYGLCLAEDPKERKQMHNGERLKQKRH